MKDLIKQYMKLSLIVIGKDESATLPLVCESFKQLAHACDGWVEMIYVDSDSRDDSVSIVSRFRENNGNLSIRIVKVTGDVNAAVARNVGIRCLDETTDYVFFLDGDIVFNRGFVFEALALLEEKKEIGSVTGLLYDYYDRSSDELFPRGDGTRGMILPQHGGNFIVRREVVESTGKFDEQLAKHQDIDYSYRIRAAGFFLYQLNAMIGTHHTESYMTLKRVVSALRHGSYLSTGIFVRKYLFSRFWRDTLGTDFVLGMIFRCVVLLFGILSVCSLWCAVVSLAMIVVLLFHVNAGRGESITARLVSILLGIQFVAGFFMRPRQKYSIQCL